MTQDTRVVTTLLDYRTQGSDTVTLATTKIIGGLQQYKVEAQSISEQLATMGVNANEVFTASGDQIAVSLTAPLDAADAAIKTVIRDLGDMGRDIESIPSPDFGAFEGEDPGGSGGGGTSPFAARRGIQAIGSLAGGQVGGDIGDVAKLVSATAAFGILGGVAGLGAIAVEKLTEKETARTKAAQDEADALDKIAQGAAGGTTESINKQIAQQTEYKQNLEDTGKQLSDYNDTINSTAKAYSEGLISQDEYTSVLHQVGTEVSDLTGGAVDAGTAVSNMTGVITDNQKHIDEASISIGGLNIELKSSTVAANNAAEAAHKVAVGQEADADRALAIDQLTKTQRDARHAQDERDIETLTRLVGAGNLNDEALANVAGRIDILNADLKDLDGVSQSYADTLEHIQTLTDQTTRYFDALSNEGKIRDEITATETDIAQTRAEAVTKEATDALAASNKIQDIETQGGLDRAKIVSDNADAIAKIERDAGRLEQGAVRDRNVDAYLTAKQNEQDKVADQKVTEDKALTTLQASITKQEKAVKTGLDTQVAATESSLAKELQVKQHTLAQEEVDLQNTVTGEIAVAESGATALTVVHINFWDTLIGITQQKVAQIALMYEVLVGNIPAGVSETPGSGSPLPNAWTNAVNGVVDTRLRQIWEG